MNVVHPEPLLCPLAREMQAEASRQFALLDQLLPEQRHEKWVSERIAYQIGWGRRLISWYCEGVQGKTPSMPGDGFLKWDYEGIAEHFHQKYLYDRGLRQTEQFRTIVSEIILIVQNEHQQGNLDRVGVWPWCTLPSGKAWTFGKWVRVNTIAPWKKTTCLLRKAL